MTFPTRFKSPGSTVYKGLMFQYKLIRTENWHSFGWFEANTFESWFTFMLIISHAKSICANEANLRLQVPISQVILLIHAYPGNTGHEDGIHPGCSGSPVQCSSPCPHTPSHILLNFGAIYCMQCTCWHALGGGRLWKKTRRHTQ